MSNGGTPVVLGQIPYQASIRSVGNVHYCSGAIINARWVLTTAECIYERELEPLLVVVGTVSRTSGGVGFQSSRVVTHPSFDFDRFYYE